MALRCLRFGDHGARTERTRRAVPGLGKLAVRREGQIEADHLGVVVVLQRIAASGKHALAAVA